MPLRIGIVTLALWIAALGAWGADTPSATAPASRSATTQDAAEVEVIKHLQEMVSVPHGGIESPDVFDELEQWFKDNRKTAAPVLFRLCYRGRSPAGLFTHLRLLRLIDPELAKRAERELFYRNSTALSILEPALRQRREAVIAALGEMIGSKIGGMEMEMIWVLKSAQESHNLDLIDGALEIVGDDLSGVSLQYLLEFENEDPRIRPRLRELANDPNCWLSENEVLKKRLEKTQE
jgi:hypothetical protein